MTANHVAEGGGNILERSGRDAADVRHGSRGGSPLPQRQTDKVVWFNAIRGIHSEKRMRWYGRTKHADYVCDNEADAAGNCDTPNGQ